MRNVGISELLGETIEKLDITHTEESPHEILFICKSGRKFLMHHEQDCCERVLLIDTAGDLIDLIDNPVLVAEEETNQEEHPTTSETWTFYKLATIKGSVTLRWHGESNGYYSESVSFSELKR